jgi:ribulose-5-phosphate 4-epimerase/fuculose-1-phosphate aldolase
MARQVNVKRPHEQFDEEEWQTRVDLAAFYRLLARYGMTDLIYNHITARVPNSPGHFLINPYGMFYSEIRASSLYKIDLDGNVISKPDTPYDINHAGYIIHSAIHSARHDLVCVAHTHGRAGMAVSAMKCGLLPITQSAMRFYGRVGYHDFEGPAVNAEERVRLARDMGQHPVLILRNHGLLVGGRTIPEAFNLLYWLENACRAQVDAMSSGAELCIPGEAALESIRKIFDTGPNGANKMLDGELEWTALIRLLDREDPSYRQ